MTALLGHGEKKPIELVANKIAIAIDHFLYKDDTYKKWSMAIAALYYTIIYFTRLLARLIEMLCTQLA